MPVIQHVFRVESLAGSASMTAARAGIDVRPVDFPGDTGSVAAVVASCAEPARTGAGDGPAPTNLSTEFASTHGRAVHGWLAWPDVESRGEAIGLITLVVVVGAGVGPPRASIGWLLVVPAYRRRGVATALVARAADHARSLGIDRLAADTLSKWSAAAGFWRSIAAPASGQTPTD